MKVGTASLLCLIFLGLADGAGKYTATPQQDVFTEVNDMASEKVAVPFDCRRMAHDCDPTGGTCNLDTGACDCNEDYAGFTCANNLLWSVVEPSKCNNGTGCGNDTQSFCVENPRKRGSNATNYSCSCPYSSFGEACEKPRFELRCSSDFMTINVNPYSTVGQIYVIDSMNWTKITNPTCSFSKTENGTTSMSTLRLAYSRIAGKCGGESGANDSYLLRFIIQSDSEWLTAYDHVVTARCSLSVTQQVQKTIVVDVASGIAGHDEKNQTIIIGQRVSNDLANVGSESIRAERRIVHISTLKPTPTITFLQELGTTDDGPVFKEINASVKIGDIVVFKITNVNDSFYTAMRVEDCVLRLDDSMTAALIKNQCPASRFAWNLLQWSNTKVTNNSLSFYLRLPANALSGQPRQITIACRVKLCADDMIDECDVYEDGCSSVTSAFLPPSLKIPNFRRKRRNAQTGSEGTAFATVRKTFEIDFATDKQTSSTAANIVKSSFNFFVSTVIFISFLFHIEI